MITMFPVIFKYYVAKKINVEAGPQIGLLTSANTTAKLNGFSASHDTNVKDNFKSLDFGLNLGAGFVF